MTPIDRFERQLPAALTDLADPRTPDYLIDILGQTARTRQRPAWVNPGRWNPMSGLMARPALLAAIAAVIIVLVGGAFLASRRELPAVGVIFRWLVRIRLRAAPAGGRAARTLLLEHVAPGRRVERTFAATGRKRQCQDHNADHGKERR